MERERERGGGGHEEEEDGYRGSREEEERGGERRRRRRKGGEGRGEKMNERMTLLLTQFTYLHNYCAVLYHDCNIKAIGYNKMCYNCIVFLLFKYIAYLVVFSAIERASNRAV